MPACRYTDVNTRTVYSASQGAVGQAGKTAKFWLNVDGTGPVDLGLYSQSTPEAPGASTGSNELTVQADGMWPAMWDRDGDQDHVWVQVGTASSPGELYRIFCDADQRADELSSRIEAVEGAIAGPVGSEWHPAATDASVRAAASAASTAGGGRVMLPAGTITLTSPLPILDGVWYVGIEPQLRQRNLANGLWLADGVPDFIGGTVLVGNGTFAAFAANTVDQETVPTLVGDTEINNAGIMNVAIDNVTYGIHVGAKNTMGLVWGKIDKVYVRNATQWGVRFVNCPHVDFGEIRTWLCQNGQYFGSGFVNSVFQPGNFTIRELYNLTPADGRDNRLCRGIVFDAGGPTPSSLAEMHTRRIQCNGYGRTLLSVSAGFTNASTSVTVPDGTKFAVGMTVRFTATNYGITANYIYVVQSVASNTLTLGTSRTTAAITATGTGSLTLETYGFPNIELIASSGSGSRIAGSTFGLIDTEGDTTVGLYCENVSTSYIFLHDIPVNALTSVVFRNTTYTEIHSVNSASTDFDANSASNSWFYGTRGTIRQRPGLGMWNDTTLGSQVLQLWSGAPGQKAGDLSPRSGFFLYPLYGMGERVLPNNGTALGGNDGGDIVFNGSGTSTYTLPTIVGDTAPASSHIGLWYEFYNVGSATITINTDGTQVFNKVVGKTSTTVVAGSSLKVIAVKDVNGNLFWLAKAPTALVS